MIFWRVSSPAQYPSCSAQNSLEIENFTGFCEVWQWEKVSKELERFLVDYLEWYVNLESRRIRLSSFLSWITIFLSWLSKNCLDSPGDFLDFIEDYLDSIGVWWYPGGWWRFGVIWRYKLIRLKEWILHNSHLHWKLYWDYMKSFPMWMILDPGGVVKR